VVYKAIEDLVYRLGKIWQCQAYVTTFDVHVPGGPGGFAVITSGSLSNC
jgi:hypothetical protein